jgi:hypothetical protein
LYKLLIILKITIMNTEEKNVMNDETRLDLEANPTSERTEHTGANQEHSDKQDASKSWVKKAAAGVGGAAAGVGAAFLFSSFKEAEEPITDPNPQTHSHSQPSPSVADFDGGEVPIAEGINDDMSFSQAFATAREEVGAGGVFFWHDGVYGTYYPNEWKGLSAEYQHTFSNYPYQPLVAESGENDPNQLTNNSSENNPVQLADNPENPENQEPVNHDDIIAMAPASDDIVALDNEVPEVEVLHAEIDGQAISFVPAYIDGQETVFIDVDNDGVYDAVMINDGTDNPPVYDLHDAGVYIGNNEIIELQDSQDPYLADSDLTDYTNDASVDSLI